MRYSLEDGSLFVLDNSAPGISTGLTVDQQNKIVYWIHHASSTLYKIFKTTYDGNTTQITEQSGASGGIDITEGFRFWYLLNVSSSTISKYSKMNDMLYARFPVYTGAKSILHIEGKNVLLKIECLDQAWIYSQTILPYFVLLL